MQERRRATGRTSREPLSRERVLAATMSLADAEGLTAVTMRRVASGLGVEAMSLYYHVPGKDSLLDGLVEAILGEIQTQIDSAIGASVDHQRATDPDWRAALRQRCLAAREVMERHRWAPGLIASRTSIPTGLYGYYEEILATLINGGFTYHLAHRAIHALGSMVLGFSQELFSPSAGGGPDDEVTEAALAEMASVLPHLTAMVAAELHDHQEDPLGWCDSRAEFEFTLDLLLDGLARQRT